MNDNIITCLDHEEKKENVNNQYTNEFYKAATSFIMYLILEANLGEEEKEIILGINAKLDENENIVLVIPSNVKFNN